MAKSSCGRNGAISNEELAQAALGIVDRYGVDALSFRKLSDETSVPTMTIMNRFGSKDALFKAALSIMLRENIVDPVPQETWQNGLRRVAHQNREMALRHPKGFMLFVMVPMFESPVLEFTQQVFSTHAGQNLPPEMPGIFLSLMHSFLSGFQLAEAYANQERERGEEGVPREVLETFDLFTEESFNRNLEVIILGLEKAYSLPGE